jgi:hypothetical protein
LALQESSVRFGTTPATKLASSNMVPRLESHFAVKSEGIRNWLRVSDLCS